MKVLFIFLALLATVHMSIPDTADARRSKTSALVKVYRKFRKPAPASFMKEVVVGGGSAVAGTYAYNKLTEEEKKEQPSSSQENKNIQPIKEERNDN